MTATVITGIGALASNGLGTEAYWDSTVKGRHGIGEISRFDATRYPVRLAGEIQDFDAAEHLSARLLRQTDVSTRLALVAAAWALADAQIDAESLVDYEMGVVTANALGGFEFTHREFRKLWTEGSQAVSVYESFAWFYAVNTGQISIRHGMRGPSSALVAEQAGGLDAIGHARRTVRRGTPLVVTGGVDSAFDPWGWVSQIASARLSDREDPTNAYLPFDRDANGFVPGEGGALLVLEDAEAAQRRAAPRIYGEIAGYASAFDPAPGLGRPPALRRAIESALTDARIGPDAVDVIFADAVGIPELDRAEAAAIREVFGPRGVPVTAPKAASGRTYSGGGPLDVASALLSIRDGVIPPVAGTSEVPDEYGVDVVYGTPRDRDVRTALVLARGLWGFNSAVVVRAWEHSH
ncbi:ketosynthase chain-length factor [Frankia sp. QA3]|uniref:ketosynthase chain-length factor n=1 Tax=Frankia sp. QA3 TaxID=710111 RepID=UPI000269C64F|nr:ketosynthase chain-length factor [Frankia sp. QA3]EIV93552.1 3-oxoacyl-(acyl-carrier-protein) synthase [Frankia sp. QA3]